MFRENRLRQDVICIQAGRYPGTERSTRGRSLQFCANGSSGPSPREGPPRNRGGKKVITFFARDVQD